LTAIASAEATPSVGKGWFARNRPGIGLHGAIVFLMIIWLIPTVGLLINSFRRVRQRLVERDLPAVCIHF
jgi:hypothetical protein